MSRRWKGDVVVKNSRFVEGSPEHEKYKNGQKKYYYATADVQRERARNRVAKKRERNQQWVLNYLSKRSCSVCGISDVRVLAFDHIDGYEKNANVSDLVSRGYALSKIIDEVGKCRVICHNCHMIHIFQQFGSYHTRLSPCTDDEFNEKYRNVQN